MANQSGESESLPSIIGSFLDPPPLLIALAGPSAVGKDVIVNRMKEQRIPFHFLATVTTRLPRPGEVDGVDYQFVTLNDYQEMLARGEFLEHAEVYGSYYGIPRSTILRVLAAHQDVLLRIGIQGIPTIKTLFPSAICILLAPASMEELMMRMQQRTSETGIDNTWRTTTAFEELEAAPIFDYVVINRNNRLDETVNVIVAIITAEKCRVGRI